MLNGKLIACLEPHPACVTFFNGNMEMLKEISTWSIVKVLVSHNRSTFLRHFQSY